MERFRTLCKSLSDFLSDIDWSFIQLAKNDLRLLGNQLECDQLTIFMLYYNNKSLIDKFLIKYLCNYDVVCYSIGGFIIVLRAATESNSQETQLLNEQPKSQMSADRQLQGLFVQYSRIQLDRHVCSRSINNHIGAQERTLVATPSTGSSIAHLYATTTS